VDLLRLLSAGLTNASLAVLPPVLSASTAVTTGIRIGAPTLKVATVWIFTAFIYDVYWVFISPYTFGDSVM